jgi:hypothetical protein
MFLLKRGVVVRANNSVKIIAMLIACYSLEIAGVHHVTA